MLILLSILQTFSDFFHMLIVWLLGRTWFWNQTLCLSARLFIACVWVWMSNCLGLDIVNPSNHPPPPCLHLSTLCICWEQIAANGYIIQAFTSKRRWQMETVKVTWQMTVFRLHLRMHLKNVNVIVIVFVFFFVIVFVIVMIPTQKSNGELLVCKGTVIRDWLALILMSSGFVFVFVFVIVIVFFLPRRAIESCWSALRTVTRDWLTSMLMSSGSPILSHGSWTLATGKVAWKI